jgi:hypothetical protein
MSEIAGLVSSFQQLATSFNGFGQNTTASINAARSEIAAVKELVLSLQRDMSVLDTRTRDATKAIETQVEASKSSTRATGTKTKAVNHRFSQMARESDRVPLLGEKWNEYKTSGIFANRYKLALDSITQQKQASPEGDLRNNDKFNGRVATQLWGSMNESEKNSFKTWSEGGAIIGFWKEDDKNATPESSASTPSNAAQFGMGNALSATAMLGSGFPSFTPMPSM